MPLTKQMKITKIFNRKAAPQLPDDCEELEQELQQLELKLKEKHDELFALQRSRHQRRDEKSANSKELLDETSKQFQRPGKIVLSNSIHSLKKEIELLALLSGMEVQSFEPDDYCTVVYHMQHDSEHEVKHGLKIDISSGRNKVASSSMPLGFKLNAVLDQYDNAMLPECLVSVRKALVAYYDRLEQFDKLKKALHVDAKLNKTQDGSHVEMTFAARGERDPPDEHVAVVLMLDYRVYDIRPKQWSFVEIDLPDGSIEALSQQCEVFKRRPLYKAFKEAFLDGVGTYTMVQQFGSQQVASHRKQKRSHPANPYNPNDDTFRPEDCSSEDDVEE